MKYDIIYINKSNSDKHLNYVTIYRYMYNQLFIKYISIYKVYYLKCNIL